MPSTDPVAAGLARQYRRLKRRRNERQRRLWAARKARDLRACGGVTFVAKAIGVSRTTIHHGLRDYDDPSFESTMQGRVRRPGGGRRKATEGDPKLLDDLGKLFEPASRAAPIRWTPWSTRRIAAKLVRSGHCVCFRTVGKLLHATGCIPDATRGRPRKREEHKQRDDFKKINSRIRRAIKAKQPVVLLESTSKALHKKPAAKRGRQAVPYLEPMASVQRLRARYAELFGGDADSLLDPIRWLPSSDAAASLAVHAIWNWWRNFRGKRFRGATELVVVSRGDGGTGGWRHRWEAPLQWLADSLNLQVVVLHLPAGTRQPRQLIQQHHVLCRTKRRGLRPMWQLAAVNVLGLAGPRDPAVNVEVVRAKDLHVPAVDPHAAKLSPRVAKLQSQWLKVFRPRAVRK